MFWFDLFRMKTERFGKVNFSLLIFLFNFLHFIEQFMDLKMVWCMMSNNDKNLWFFYSSDRLVFEIQRKHRSKYVAHFQGWNLCCREIFLEISVPQNQQLCLWMYLFKWKSVSSTLSINIALKYCPFFNWSSLE